MRFCRKTLDILRLTALLILIRIFLSKGLKVMFDDLFDFGKKRSLKQSVGFFIFHSTLMLGFMAGLTMLGVS